MSRERMSVIFERSPEEALEETFRRYAERCPWDKDSTFMYTCEMGLDGVRYGSFKTVRKSNLVYRKFNIEFWDGAVSLFYTDVFHHPRLHRSIPKDFI